MVKKLSNWRGAKYILSGAQKWLEEKRAAVCLIGRLANASTGAYAPTWTGVMNRKPEAVARKKKCSNNNGRLPVKMANVR